MKIERAYRDLRVNRPLQAAYWSFKFLKDKGMIRFSLAVRKSGVVRQRQRSRGKESAR